MKRYLFWLFHKDVFYPSKCQHLTVVNSLLCRIISNSGKIPRVFEWLTFKQVFPSIGILKSLWLNSTKDYFSIIYYHKYLFYKLSSNITFCLYENIRRNCNTLNVLTVSLSLSHHAGIMGFLPYPQCFGGNGNIFCGKGNCSILVVCKNKFTVFYALHFFCFLHNAY